PAAAIGRARVSHQGMRRRRIADRGAYRRGRAPLSRCGHRARDGIVRGGWRGVAAESLSSRELEVALMLARGLAVNEVANRLHLSAKTVSTYKQRLFEKLGVQHTIALAHLLTVHGLLDEPSVVAG